MLAAILFASAALQAWLGEAGLLLATFLSGFADTHAPAISAAALAGSGHMAPQGAVLPVLAAFTRNTVSKIAFAAAGGGRALDRKSTRLNSRHKCEYQLPSSALKKKN